MCVCVCVGVCRCDDVVAEANNTYPSYIQPGDEAEEFHKVRETLSSFLSLRPSLPPSFPSQHWISIVQGNIPCTPEQAVKLAAIQYQAYFLDRTAIHSVVGFCRYTLLVSFACIGSSFAMTLRGVRLVYLVL